MPAVSLISIAYIRLNFTGSPLAGSGDLEFTANHRCIPAMLPATMEHFDTPGVRARVMEMHFSFYNSIREYASSMTSYRWFACVFGGVGEGGRWSIISHIQVFLDTRKALYGHL